MAQIDDRRVLSLLHEYSDGLTSPEVTDILIKSGESVKALGGIPKMLSNMLTEGAVAATTSPRNNNRVYVHLTHLSLYKPTELLKKTKKVDNRQRCLDLYHDYATTGNKHSLELAERLYKEIK